MDGDGALGSGDCLQSRADPEREAVSHTASDHKRSRLKGVLLLNLQRLHHKASHYCAFLNRSRDRMVLFLNSC
jgi:hypothetical protein